MDGLILIRQEEARDFEQICELVRLAFRDMEESDHTEHLLVERLRRSDAYVQELALVAEAEGGRIVGHILLTRLEVVSEEDTHIALAVAPLSVLPGFQGRGIGGALLRAAHERAAGLGYGAALLLGHPGYYPKFGYQKASLYGIQFPFEAPDECCMVAELKSGGLDGLRGVVCYPAPFFG